MAIKVLREYGISSKLDKYNLMIARGGNLMDYDGQRMNVRAYMLVEDTHEDGEIVKAFKAIVVYGDNEEIVGSNSPVFIRGLETFLDFMETDELKTFVPVQKLTQKGKRCLTFQA